MQFSVNVKYTDYDMPEDQDRDKKLHIIGPTIHEFDILKDVDEHIVKYRLVLGSIDTDMANIFIKEWVDYVQILGSDGAIPGKNNSYQLLLEPYEIILDEGKKDLHTIKINLVSSKVCAIMKDTSFSVANSSSREDYDTLGTSRRYLTTLLSDFGTKYKISTGSIVTKGDANFNYRKLFLPSMSGFDMVKALHDSYPPARFKIPWIFDEANIKLSTTNLDYLTETVYKEINLANMDEYQSRILKDLIGPMTIITQLDEVEFYGKTDKDDIDNTTFIVKTSGGNTQKIYEAKEKVEYIDIPVSSEGEMEIKQEKINRNKIVNIMVPYDSTLFESKLSFLKQHLELKPKLVFYKFTNVDPRMLSFNVKYALDFKIVKNPVYNATPYRINYYWRPDGEFSPEHKESVNYKLDIEVAFYVCDNVIK